MFFFNQSSGFTDVHILICIAVCVLDLCLFRMKTVREQGSASRPSAPVPTGHPQAGSSGSSGPFAVGRNTTAAAGIHQRNNSSGTDSWYSEQASPTRKAPAHLPLEVPQRAPPAPPTASSRVPPLSKVMPSQEAGSSSSLSSPQTSVPAGPGVVITSTPKRNKPPPPRRHASLSGSSSQSNTKPSSPMATDLGVRGLDSGLPANQQQPVAVMNGKLNTAHMTGYQGDKMQTPPSSGGSIASHQGLAGQSSGLSPMSSLARDLRRPSMDNSSSGASLQGSVGVLNQSQPNSRRGSQPQVTPTFTSQSNMDLRPHTLVSPNAPKGGSKFSFESPIKQVQSPQSVKTIASNIHSPFGKDHSPPHASTLSASQQPLPGPKSNVSSMVANFQQQQQQLQQKPQLQTKMAGVSSNALDAPRSSLHPGAGRGTASGVHSGAASPGFKTPVSSNMIPSPGAVATPPPSTQPNLARPAASPQPARNLASSQAVGAAIANMARQPPVQSQPQMQQQPFQSGSQVPMVVRPGQPGPGPALQKQPVPQAAMAPGPSPALMHGGAKTTHPQPMQPGPAALGHPQQQQRYPMHQMDMSGKQQPFNARPNAVAVAAKPSGMYGQRRSPNSTMAGGRQGTSPGMVPAANPYGGSPVAFNQPGNARQPPQQQSFPQKAPGYGQAQGRPIGGTGSFGSPHQNSPQGTLAGQARVSSSQNSPHSTINALGRSASNTGTPGIATPIGTPGSVRPGQNPQAYHAAAKAVPTASGGSAEAARIRRREMDMLYESDSSQSWKKQPQSESAKKGFSFGGSPKLNNSPQASAPASNVNTLHAPPPGRQAQHYTSSPAGAGRGQPMAGRQQVGMQARNPGPHGAPGSQPAQYWSPGAQQAARQHQQSPNYGLV